MSEKGDSVLVLGATSLVGRFLLPLLVEHSVSPVVLTRRVPPPPPPLGRGDVTSNAPSDKQGDPILPCEAGEGDHAQHGGGGGGARWVQGDLTKPETLTAVGPVTEVYSLSPIWLLPDALPALTALGVRRLIAFSSTSVITKANSTSAAERGVAARLAEGEARTLAWAEANGAWCVILRPTLIYAEGHDANVSRIAGLIRRVGIIPMAGDGAGLRQPVHAQDLARGAMDAMRSDTATGVYAVPGGETLTYRAMVERVFEGMGRRPMILPIPAPLFRLALGLASPFLPGTTQEMGARIGEDLIFDAEPARRDFGWSPRAFRPDFTKPYSS